MNRLKLILEDGRKDNWKPWQFVVVIIDQIFHPFKTTYPIAHCEDKLWVRKPNDCLLVIKRYYNEKEQIIWYIRKY